MSLFKLKPSTCILIEDDYDKNILPLLSELVEVPERQLLVMCYEQPEFMWQNVFKHKSVQYFKASERKQLISTLSEKCVCLIDSVNQMVLDIGWNDSLNFIQNLHTNPLVSKLILILHRDCQINPKLQIHLNHLANAIVSFDGANSQKIKVQVKKGGKFFKSEEVMSYDKNSSTLKLTTVVKEEKKIDEPQNILPSNLSTFKIETDQIQQLEKHKLKLPYMSKINEGQGKVYYEPDAVDDWDDEDPDDDLDI